MSVLKQYKLTGAVDIASWDSTRFTNSSLIWNGSDWVAFKSGGASVGGSDTQVQYNDNGNLGGDSSFTWDATLNVLTVAGAISAQRISGALTTNDLTINANTISGLADPTYPSAAANKNYVDTISGNLAAGVGQNQNVTTISSQKISGGTYIGGLHYPADYTVYRDVETYYVIDSGKGTTLQSGTDFSTVMNASIVKGRSFYVRPGNYYISASLYIPSSVSIRGEPVRTVFHNGANIDLFIISSGYHTYVGDFKVQFENPFTSDVFLVKPWNTYHHENTIANVDIWSHPDCLFSGTALHLHASGASLSQISFDTYRNISAYRISTGIKLTLDGAYGYINANNFTDIRINGCYTGIDCNVTDYALADDNIIGGNIFDSIQINSRTTPLSKNGIKLWGQNNYINAQIYDWPDGSLGHALCTMSGSRRNYILIGHTDEADCYISGTQAGVIYIDDNKSVFTTLHSQTISGGAIETYSISAQNISGGTFNKLYMPYDYAIFKIGSEYFAKRGRDGAIVSSCTTLADNIFQYVIDQMDDGGKLYLASGIYHITDSITVDKSISIEGAGVGRSVVPTTNPITCIFANVGWDSTGYMLYYNNDSEQLYAPYIKNINFDANSRTSVKGGIQLRNTTQAVIENVCLDDFYASTATDYPGSGIAILLVGTAGLGSYYNEIRNCRARRCTVGFMLSSNCNGNMIQGGMIGTSRTGTNYRRGIVIDGGDTNVIYGPCDIEDFDSDPESIGVYITSSNGGRANRFFGLRMEGLGEGVRIANGTNCGSNSFVGCSFLTATVNDYETVSNKSAFLLINGMPDKHIWNHISSSAISGTTIKFNAFAGQTNATAAEVEELTDGSETTLHSHAAAASAPAGSFTANIGSDFTYGISGVAFVSSQLISGGTIKTDSLTISADTISGLAAPTYNSGAANKYYADNPDYVSSQAISGGSYMNIHMPATYTVFKTTNGGYYARKGSDGSVAYSNANASTVLNSCFSSLSTSNWTGSGTVCLGTDITIDAEVSGGRCVIFDLMGHTIRPNGDFNMFRLNDGSIVRNGVFDIRTNWPDANRPLDHHACIIWSGQARNHQWPTPILENLTFYGGSNDGAGDPRSSAGQSGSAVFIQLDSAKESGMGVSNFTFTNLHMHRMGYGIRAETLRSSNTINNVKVLNCNFESCKYGLYLSGNINHHYLDSNNELAGWMVQNCNWETNANVKNHIFLGPNSQTNHIHGFIFDSSDAQNCIEFHASTNNNLISINGGPYSYNKVRDNTSDSTNNIVYTHLDGTYRWSRTPNTSTGGLNISGSNGTGVYQDARIELCNGFLITNANDTETWIYGGDNTADELFLRANSVDSYPLLKLVNNGEINLRFNTGDKVVIEEQTTDIATFDAGGLTMNQGGISSQAVSGGTFKGVSPMMYSIANTRISANQNINLAKFQCPSDKKAFIYQAYACGSGSQYGISGLQIEMLAGTAFPLDGSDSVYKTSSQIMQIGNPLGESSAGDCVEIRFMYSGTQSNLTGIKYGTGGMQVGIY